MSASTTGTRVADTPAAVTQATGNPVSDAPTPPDIIASFEQVCFTYPGTDSPALDNVSFAIARSEACALVGPNGSGKSTALRLLVGLDHPTSGVVRFDGTPVDAPALSNRMFAKRLRQRVGLVFQDPDAQLFCPTVHDEIAFGPRQMGLSPSEVARRTEDCLRLFDLAHLAERATWRLSGGEKRRCAIACVVSLAPELLCLDEPTNGLDEGSRRDLVAFLKSYITAGRTVLIATHDATLVEELAAREVRLA